MGENWKLALGLRKGKIMTKRYILQKEGIRCWALRGRGDQRAALTAETKQEALSQIRGMSEPRSVVFRNPYDGTFSEERTYPRKFDPRRSVG